MTNNYYCVLCRSPLSDAFSDHKVSLMCNRCDHTWFDTTRLPNNTKSNNLFGDWDKDYYGDNKIFEYHKARLSGFEAIVTRLNQAYPQRGRLLDIGTGVGMMMKAAAEGGWLVEGVEPSPTAAKWAHEITGATVHIGFLEELKLSEKHYDAITMVDVLRTIPDAKSVLASATRLLRPGGILLIREGNRRVLRSVSWCREWLKGNVRGQTNAAIRRGTDCHSFSPASIVYGLRQAGCTQCWVEPSPPFLEVAPGASVMVPNIKRFATLTSRFLYAASRRRWVISPGMLAFGRIAKD